MKKRLSAFYFFDNKGLRALKNPVEAYTIMPWLFDYFDLPNYS